MFVPIPVLIVLAAGFAALIFLALRRRRRDPLMGGQPKLLARSRQEPAKVPIAAMSPQDETQIRALVAANRKIEAIKLAREVTGLGLKDAKDFVEALP